MMWVVSKATIVCTNVPGPKVGLNYRGTKCTGFIALVPGLGDLACGFSSLSMGDNLFFCI